MKKRLLIIAMVILFVINITALTTLSYNRWLKPKPTDSQIGPSDTWRAVQTQVSLSQQQLKRMQGLRFSFEKEIESFRQQMWEKRNSLIEEARNPSPDLERLDKIIEELSELQAKVQKKTIRNLLKDKKLLAPWQQERYFSLFERHMHGRGWGHGRKGFGRRGPQWLRESQKEKERNRK